MAIIKKQRVVSGIGGSEMKASGLVVLLAAAMASFLTGCETQPRYGDVMVREPHYSLRVVFTDDDRRLIREYYEPRYQKLPPGLAKKGWIPPGMLGE
jgi:hypothetical protein